MIERTQRRLRQARFFYQHLLNERQQTTFRHDLEAFEFYFSAFIRSARTVTWTLKNEETEKWKEWEPKWRAKRSTDEQKLLDITNEFRIDEEKKGGTNLTVELEEIAVHELLSANLGPRRQHPANLPYEISPLGMRVAQPKTLRHAYYFTNEEGKEEVTALCQRYLNFLEKMVRDFCEDNR
jgi:hypothetical protein